jgi:hypothetical protein
MAERIQRDYDCAYKRGDIVRGMRHARRIEMIEYALIANSPCEGVSTFNSFSRA